MESGESLPLQDMATSDSPHVVQMQAGTSPAKQLRPRSSDLSPDAGTRIANPREVDSGEKDGAKSNMASARSADTSSASHDKAFPLSTVKELVASARRGSGTRDHRIFRKVAGALCRRAREELRSAGLLWSKAAWDGGLHAAMAGLEGLAGTADARLEQGFERVLTSIKQAHLEGLQRSASASRGSRRAPASPAPASRSTTNQARPPAGGTSRRARMAREELATYLFGDKVPYGLLCKDCSSPATCARRGGKGGGDIKCFCEIHERSNPGNPGCFKLEKTRAACDAYQHDNPCWDTTPKSRLLIAKLLLIGGIESNPGWPASQSQKNENKDGPAPNVSLRRPLVILPSREDVERSWQPACDQRGVPDKFLEYLTRKQQMNPSLAIPKGGLAPGTCESGVNEGITQSVSSGEKPSANKAQDEKELDHQDMVEKGPFTALLESNFAAEESQLSTSVRGIARVADESKGCSATKEESGSKQRWTTSAADESDFKRSGSEEEGEDIEGAEFESMSKSLDEETSQDREMIDDGSQVEENSADQAGLVPTTIETDSEFDELPARLKRRVSDGAACSSQTRRRRRVLLSSSESSGENGSVSAWQSDAAGLDEEVQQLGGDKLMPDASASFYEPSEPEDDGCFDESDFGEDFTSRCLIVPRPRRATIGQ
ncbi:hypothetical protein KFL_007990010, partial [Klebsormidium nitens]